MKMKSFNTDGEFATNYKFLIGSILPRPIAWISSINEDGSNNLAPFSFFTAVSAQPMIIAFCPMIRSSTGEIKDTAKNILERKHFVINFVTEELAQKVNTTSQEVPYGEDEFKLANLTPIDSLKVKAKRVAESPVHFECHYRDHLSYGNHPGAGMIITGEVLQVHVNEDILDGDKIDTKRFNPVGRGAGNDWFRCLDTFQLERLMRAQIQK